jgi:hypothetical protein
MVFFTGYTPVGLINTILYYGEKKHQMVITPRISKNNNMKKLITMFNDKRYNYIVKYIYKRQSRRKWLVQMLVLQTPALKGTMYILHLQLPYF